MHERLIDRSCIGFASAVFKDRRVGAAGDSRLGLSKLNSMRPARRGRKAPHRKMRGPGPVDVLAARSVAVTLTAIGPKANGNEFSAPCRTCPRVEGSLERR